LKEQNLTPSLALICYDTPKYIAQLIPTMRTWGKIASIVECDDPLPLHVPVAFARSLSFHWEFMFAKGVAGYDLESQGRALEKIGQLAADGTLESMVTEREVLSVESLRRMHTLQESGKAIGKVTFEVPETLS
jgi:NADPH2:quinone reductase